MRRLGADFDEFVIGRSSALLRTATLLTGDSHDAEDLVQTALLRVARHWSRALDNPEAYTRRVLVNLAHDRSRRRKRRPEHLGPPPDRVAPDDYAEDRDDLLRLLRQLPDRQRATVVLRYWEDLSVAETAQLLGCTEGTVKSATSKALTHLREALNLSLTDSIGAKDAH
ncbi:SigE family RNA polymerase sigma factor [Nocardioides dongxiaopingii]|uniref:SigE family RNA polymerase sigma factor n=1 Tax=Nocardioides sp. S-1144 TaxID=2582905 RepID=UPI00110F0B6D|nr:SigE family RNA polymerase sigma factor [Nocardioides sp. S-1144]QCW50334.1 SigE family RNA polymerase sigma factor [Nocardioides sp. S-1144]